MSHVWEQDVINPGGDIICRESDVMNTVHLMSYKMWCDVIKCGCDALYRVYDVTHIVGVMSYIQRL